MKYVGRLFLLTLAAVSLTQMVACAQAPTPQGRPAPLTSTVLTVCDHGHQKLAVVIFTFENGKVLIVDKDSPQGFTTVADLLQYADTAPQKAMYGQPCEGVSI